MRIRASKGSTGQASVELVAAIPFIVLMGLVVLQFVITGHALWVTSNAARVGARAAAVGGDVEDAVRSALPDRLEHGLRVETGDGDGRVAVDIRVPMLFGAIVDEAIPVGAAARLAAPRNSVAP